MILARRRWRLEDQKFKVILGYIGEFKTSLGYRRPSTKEKTHTHTHSAKEFFSLKCVYRSVHVSAGAYRSQEVVASLGTGVIDSCEYCIWMLGTKLEPSIKAASSLNC